VIAVPGPKNTQGFTLEVIPYEETLSFKPVVVAGNRGPFVDGVQEEQNLTGLIYEQRVFSSCDTDFCKQRGFAPGTEIHAETGIFLNVTNFDSSFNIARLSTIPHGNSVLAMGQSFQGVPPDNNFFGPAFTAPTNINGGPVGILGYSEVQYGTPQFPQFNQADPNTFLQKSLGTSQITEMTTLNFSTKNPSGGILNIPFIKNNMDTISMGSTFWIEQIKNPVAGQPDIMQLQYTQTINIVFPPTGFNVPIIWPHITINTLQKV
ncbi:MAG: heme-binding protein, partial [Bacteroidia bacterium]